MNLREKIEFLMARDKITKKSDLARVLGIPYTTIDNILKRDHFENVKFDTLKRLCDYFHVDLHYLIRDEITDPAYGLTTAPAPSLSSDEQQLLEDYRAVSAEGQEKIRDYVADLRGNPKYKKCDSAGLAQQA